MVYRDARARLDFRIQMNSQILRSMRASKLDWQHHKNWANSLKARLKADFRPPTDEQLLHHLTMKKHPAARELRLAIAMREVVGAIKATKKAKETLGFKPPYDADSLFPDAIKKDLEAREQKAVDRAKASLDAVLRLPTRSLFNPFSWKYPSACEHVAKRDIAQAELSRALLSQNLVSSMTGAYIAAEQERRKKINKTWVSESLRLNETRVLQFAVLQLAKDGDSQIQFALASGGTAKAAEILKERQIERTRVKAEEERIRREEEAKMCAAWASQTQRQALPEPTRPPPAPLGPSFGRGF